MDININTVYLWLRKYSKDGNIDRKIGSGRKKNFQVMKN
jgi:transposase